MKIGKSIKDISNFSILLLLFIFTYMMLGMEMFAYNVKLNELNKVDPLGESPRTNFDRLDIAFTTIFIVLLGEDWNSVMNDHVRVMGDMYILFFVSLYVFGNLIMLNLFLAILLKNFEEKEKEDDGEKKAGPGISQTFEISKSIFNQIKTKITMIFKKKNKTTEVTS
jgi:hypothetical protein